MLHLPVPYNHHLAISYIRKFFSNYSLPAALKTTDALFSKATGHKALGPAKQYNAVQLCRQLHKLSKAARLLSSFFAEAYAQKITVGQLDGWPAVLRQTDYSRTSHSAAAFSDFPRQLAKDEYCYPSRAIGRYCRFRTKKGWKKFYRRLLRCALSTTSLLQYEKPGRLFALRRQVHKLVEACQLIHVRLGNVQVVVE